MDIGGAPVEHKSPWFPSDQELQDVARGLMETAFRDDITVLDYIKQVVERFQGVDLSKKIPFIRHTILVIVLRHRALGPPISHYTICKAERDSATPSSRSL